MDMNKLLEKYGCYTFNDGVMKERLPRQTYIAFHEALDKGESLSKEIAADIDKEIKKIVDEQYALAKQLLTDNKDMLEYIAKQLLEKETLDEKEFEEMMNEVRSKRTFDNWQG